MRVGVIDVGSNTVRLLVAALENETLSCIREERTALGVDPQLLAGPQMRDPPR